MKKYNNGLIVGKFSPLHKGHQFIIETALKDCERLTILSYSNPEFPKCGSSNRESWLKELYPMTNVVVLNGSELTLPSNEDDPLIHRQFVARVWKTYECVPLDVVYTSEYYGEPFVEELNKIFTEECFQENKVEHVMVDLLRQNVPVSASFIRSSYNSEYLDPIVKKGVVTRVCLLGAESTGKSTLSKKIAEVLGCSFVDEYGRTLYDEKGGVLELPDMLKIAKTQIEKEEETGGILHICDTSPLTTYFYSLSFFGMAEDELYHLSHREYDLYFLCANDFKHVQDGTREGEDFQKRQQSWYIRTLGERKISYVTLTGSIEERIAKAIAHIQG